MKHRWRTGVAGVLAALVMTTSAGAVGETIEIDGTSLSPSEAWIENGTSYVTLAAFCRETGRTLGWNGTAARIDGGGLDLEAPFQEFYVLSNDRALYTGEPVTVVNGRSALPLRVLAEASGAELTWDWDTATASLNTRGAHAASGRLQRRGPVLALPDYLRGEQGGAPAGTDRSGQCGAQPGEGRPVPQHRQGGDL